MVIFWAELSCHIDMSLDVSPLRLVSPSQVEDEATDLLKVTRFEIIPQFTIFHPFKRVLWS